MHKSLNQIYRFEKRSRCLADGDYHPSRLKMVITIVSWLDLNLRRLVLTLDSPYSCLYSSLKS